MRTLAVIGLRLSGPRTAMGRYIEYLAREWSRMETPFDRIVLFTRGVSELEGLGTTTPVEIEPFDERLPALLWEQIGVPLRARRASVLFCPSYVGPLLRSRPLVVANHGIYARLPDEFPLLQRLRSTPIQRMSARFAARVIANSEQTRDDIVRFFHVTPDRVDVVYPAADKIFFERHDPEAIAAVASQALGTTAPYVMFVGKLARRRNVPNLIRAFARVRREHTLPHHLLIVGPNTSDVPISVLCEEEEVSGVVAYHPHLEQEPLARLYAGATAFVLPTTYEGISYTMFEAMASGAPVLTVDHPTVEEGPGDAVLAIPTPSVDDIADGLSRLLTNATLRQDLTARGRASAAAFSWENAARQTMEVLARVARAHD